MVGSRWMELPRIVAVGSGVILELSEICRQLQLQGRALIITGPRTLDVMGKAIFELLEDGGYEPETLICSDSKLEEVGRAATRDSTQCNLQRTPNRARPPQA